MGLVCVLGIVMFVRPIMLYPAGLRPCRAIFMPFSLQMLPMGSAWQIRRTARYASKGVEMMQVSVSVFSSSWLTSA